MDTWSLGWLGSGLLVWIIGFVRAGSTNKKNGLLVEQSFIHPPFFIYLVCGMPKAQNIPPGVMSVPGLMSQLVGLFWLAYGLTDFGLPPQKVELQILIWFIGTMVLIPLYVLRLYNRNRYMGD